MIEPFLYYMIQFSNTPCSTIQLPNTVVPQFCIVHEHTDELRSEMRQETIILTTGWLTIANYDVCVLCCVCCFSV